VFFELPPTRFKFYPYIIFNFLKAIEGAFFSSLWIPRCLRFTQPSVLKARQNTFAQAQAREGMYVCLSCVGVRIFAIRRRYIVYVIIGGHI
jgi:hypothetical protein